MSDKSETVSQIVPKKKPLIKRIWNIVINITLFLIVVSGVYFYMTYSDTGDIKPTPVSEIVSNMYKADLGTGIVNGKSVDLNQLRNELRTLYFYAEPLTEEEVKEQFLGIIEYIKKVNRKNKTFGDGKSFDVFGYYVSDGEELAQEYNEILFADYNTIENLDLRYSFILKNYNGTDFPLACLQYADGGGRTFDQLKFDEVDQFVRDWKYYFNVSWRAHELANRDPKPQLEY